VGVYKEILRVLKPGGVFAGYEWCMTVRASSSASSDPIAVSLSPSPSLCGSLKTSEKGLVVPVNQVVETRVSRALLATAVLNRAHQTPQRKQRSRLGSERAHAGGEIERTSSIPSARMAVAPLHSALGAPGLGHSHAQDFLNVLCIDVLG
jgi:hypothetical protein